MITLLGLSTYHILILVLILVILFGAKKIPELMRGFGTGIKEFKDAVKEEDKTVSPKQNSTTSTSTPVYPFQQDANVTPPVHTHTDEK